MIADVAFDAPVDHPFSYRIPAGLAVAPGQRVWAPLRGAARLGMVVAVRDGAEAGLKPLARPADPAPVLGPRGLELVHWIAAQSLSSVGATCGALLPPPPVPPGEDAPPGGGSPRPAPAGTPELLVGGGREKRLLERIERAAGPVLVLAPDVEASARWAQRLARFGRVARLDSGVADDARAAAWRALADGATRLATGTRSALLAPLAPRATVALLDEQEAAHKPPGPPRIHTRDVLLERAARESLALVLTAATPSVETWWRADSGRLAAEPARPGPWPAVTLADTRGILKVEPLTPPLARAIRETLAAGRRVFLGVSRLASSLACDECGDVVRCAECRIALAYSRAAATLVCRLCARPTPLPDTCPACRGRRLSPFGWGAERVEHAVRRRFPDARVARYDPDATRGARGEAQRAAATAADVVIGTRGALRLFGPAALGLAGFVAPDQLLRLPDFRAGERTFALLWAAAERVRPDGAVVVQSQNPTHYAFAALSRQDLPTFYRHELRFRAELGYPPFRRLAVVSARGAAGDASRLGAALAAALAGAPGLTVYPPAADRRGRLVRLVVKGGAELPDLLRAALAEFRGGAAGRRGIMDVEVDPVEWRS
ncbi:MAG: primosomal protein N' [Candidatus Rokubacteria bacterium RIFCSPLOWO2_12_FULL_73_47]|nr:MAG: primosomal protein N' [Candidatus Rokubacteria bacterium RIFCSPLOWO2_12_FULL_73_47]